MILKRTGCVTVHEWAASSYFPTWGHLHYSWSSSYLFSCIEHAWFVSWSIWTCFHEKISLWVLFYTPHGRGLAHQGLWAMSYTPLGVDWHSRGCEQMLSFFRFGGGEQATHGLHSTHWKTYKPHLLLLRRGSAYLQINYMSEPLCWNPTSSIKFPWL